MSFKCTPEEFVACLMCNESIQPKSIHFLEVLRNENICVKSLLKKALDKDVSNEKLVESYLCKSCYDTIYAFFKTEQKMNQLRLEMMSKFIMNTQKDQMEGKKESDSMPSAEVVQKKPSVTNEKLPKRKVRKLINCQCTGKP